MEALPRAARRYIIVVCAVAGILVAFAIRETWGSSTEFFVSLVCLAALYALSDAVKSQGIQDRAGTTLSNVVILSTFPLVGLWGSILVSVSTLVLHTREEPFYKRLFNTGQLTISAAFGGGIFVILGGNGVVDVSFPSLLMQIVVADFAYCILNAALVAGILRVAENVPVRVVLEGTIAKQSVPYLGYGLFGLLLAVLWDGVGIGPFAAVLVLLPLYVARWAYAQYAEQQLAYDRTIQTLVQAVETKDLYTRGHSERVATASVMIARQIGMREDRVSVLRYAGILHDVGKLGVPTRVLQKSGRLTDEEYEAIKLHPVRGLEVVRQIEFLGEAYAGIMHHHERIDGRGYPMGLKGDQIPEFARVIAVADAFDSMTTTRSYRDARPIADAIEELYRCAGTQFDPVMVKAMVQALQAEEWAPEQPPVPPVDDDAEGFGYDHDDPTVSIGPGFREDGPSR